MRGLRHFLTLFCITTVAISFFSCNDDENEVDIDLNREDARIRSVEFLNFDLGEQTMVINDVESIIFNYDSLGMGVVDTAVVTYIYGYTSQPKIQYLEDGEWKSFTNGQRLDLSEPLQILSTSEDGVNQKRYTLEIRIHTYDVAAFTWEQLATISDYSSLVSQKAITVGSEYRWYCANESGQNLLYQSTTGADWSMKELSSEAMDWSTLLYDETSFYVMGMDGAVYSSTDGISFAKAEFGKQPETLLFVNNGRVWAIAEGSDGKSLFSKSVDADEFEEVCSLPSNFPTENIVAFTAMSGRTSLAYLYATETDGGVVWTVDEKGNVFQLLAPGTIPALVNPMPFVYDNTLGLIGGEENGKISSKCYVSYNSGKSWKLDTHKDLVEIGNGISQAGLIVTSRNGELMLIGGKSAQGYQTTVWKGVLNKLNEDELIYGK